MPTRQRDSYALLISGRRASDISQPISKPMRRNTTGNMDEYNFNSLALGSGEPLRRLSEPEVEVAYEQEHMPIEETLWAPQRVRNYRETRPEKALDGIVICSTRRSIMPRWARTSAPNERQKIAVLQRLLVPGIELRRIPREKPEGKDVLGRAIPS